jgi:uncharacterized protein YbaA (DUF1428 family)
MDKMPRYIDGFVLPIPKGQAFNVSSRRQASGRDLANERVAADPRMAQLVEPLTKSPKPIFEPTRMAYGGFRSLV